MNFQQKTGVISCSLKATYWPKRTPTTSKATTSGILGSFPITFPATLIAPSFTFSFSKTEGLSVSFALASGSMSPVLETPLVPTSTGKQVSFSNLSFKDAQFLMNEGKFELIRTGSLRFNGLRCRGGGGSLSKTVASEYSSLDKEIRTVHPMPTSQNGDSLTASDIRGLLKELIKQSNELTQNSDLDSQKVVMTFIQFYKTHELDLYRGLKSLELGGLKQVFCSLLILKIYLKIL